MDAIFRFSSSARRDPAIEDWLQQRKRELAAIARRWFGTYTDMKRRRQAQPFDR